MTEQQTIEAHIATKGVIKCPTACSVKTTGVYLSEYDKEKLRRHQEIQNRIKTLKELLFKEGPYY